MRTSLTALRAEGLLLAVIAAALWGLAPTATKGALGVANPAAIVLLRIGSAALLFRLLAKASGQPVGRDRWAWLGGSALAADFLLYTYGLQYTTAAVAGLLINVEPVATLLLARWLLGERFTTHRGVGAVLILTGVLLASSDGLSWTELSASRRAAGNGAIVLAGISWSVYAVSQRRALPMNDFWPRLAALFEVAFLVSLPLALPLARFEGPGGFSNWSALAVLVLFCTAGVYMVYARAQHCLEVSVLALLLAAIPVFNLAFAHLLLREAISPSVLVATALVISGIAAITAEPAFRSQRRERGTEAARLATERESR